VHREVINAKRSDPPGPAGLFVIGLLELPAQDRVVGRKCRKGRKQKQKTGQARALTYSKPQPELRCGLPIDTVLDQDY